MNNSEFENIIQKKFKGASSEVPTNAWVGVSSQIGTTGASSGLFTSVTSKIIAGAAVLGVVTTSVIYLTSTVSIKESTLANHQIEKTQTEKTVQTEIADTPEEEAEIKIVEETKTPTSVKPITSNSKSENTVSEYNTESEISEAIVEDVSTMLTDVSQNQTSEVTETTEESASNEGSDSQAKEIKLILPSKILSRIINQENLQYSYSISESQNIDLEVKWYINDELVSENESFSYNYPVSGDYTIIGQLIKDKKVVKTLFHTENIQEQAVIKVPNTFSPHSSYGVNNVFDIDHNRSKLIKSYEISIFDENQTLVFRSNSDQTAWDGYINGNPAVPKTYLYVINYTTENLETKTLKGYVVLQR